MSCVVLALALAFSGTVTAGGSNLPLVRVEARVAVRAAAVIRNSTLRNHEKGLLLSLLITPGMTEDQIRRMFGLETACLQASCGPLINCVWYYFDYGITIYFDLEGKV